MKIEGFRSLNEDIKTIINKSEAVKKAKKEGTEHLTSKERKELTEEEKEYKSKRKQIQEKLIKFATRIPVFMYLTDYRERCLKDVITQLEPGLFKKVTGLDVNDFELLLSLGVFNDSRMNDAVYKFKRYEDASLSYTGINRHEGEDRGGWDTVISDEDYNNMFHLQQSSMNVINPQQKHEASGTTQQTESIPIQNKNEDSITSNNDSIAEKAKANINNGNRNIKKKKKFKATSVKKGTRVIHKAFGTGIVSEIASGHIVVNFNGVLKQFHFPSAFQQGFLTLE